MKQGVVLISFVSVFLFCVPVFGQVQSRGMETLSIDTFDTPSFTTVSYGNTANVSAETVEWQWKTTASRYVVSSFPKIGHFDGIPNSLRQLRSPDDPDPKVLGVQVKFNRKGDNWLEIYPVRADAAEGADTSKQNVPLKGTVSQFDFWVWGAGYNYFLDIMVRDSDGRVIVFPATNLKFNGWRNVIVQVPKYVKQSSGLRSGPETIAFVGFRVRTSHEAPTDDYIIYFDNLKYTSGVISNIYDGYELRKQNFDAASEGAQ